jgi:hypothetical protein
MPLDPRFVPVPQADAAAIAVLRAAAPDADDIASETDEHIMFRDCGENFEAVRCPGCGAEIAIETWQEWMDADYTDDGGFRLEPLTTRCCGIRETLNGLVYVSPQGFSRYVLSGMNMNLGRELPAGLVDDLESALGCRLRVIRQMI